MDQQLWVYDEHNINFVGLQPTVNKGFIKNEWGNHGLNLVAGVEPLRMPWDLRTISG